MKNYIGWLCALSMLISTQGFAENAPLTLELFTSQGCSSCPPANALLKTLAADPQIIALSFHVHYWDYLGWKDPYASEQNTDRQRQYAQLLGSSVYTPQLVINGQFAMVGSDKDEVQAALAKARGQLPIANIEFAPQSAEAVVTAITANPPYGKASVWAMQFQPMAQTDVLAGENNGRKLESINNVTRITKLGAWERSGQHFPIPASDHAGDRMAIVLQMNGQGAILAANTPPAL